MLKIAFFFLPFYKERTTKLYTNETNVLSFKVLCFISETSGKTLNVSYNQKRKTYGIK